MTLPNTYTQILASLQAWEADQDADWVAQIPEIISMGENRLIRDLNLEIFNFDDTGTVSANVNSITKPANCITVKSLQMLNPSTGKYFFLFKRDVDYIRYYATSSSSGVPKFYAEKDENDVIFGPYNNTSRGYRLRYTKRPEGLSASNDSTWISQRIGDVLFYAILAAAQEYLKEDLQTEYGRTVTFEAKYQGLMSSQKNELREMIQRDYKPIQEGPVKEEGDKP